MAELSFQVFLEIINSWRQALSTFTASGRWPRGQNLEGGPGRGLCGRGRGGGAGPGAHQEVLRKSAVERELGDPGQSLFSHLPAVRLPASFLTCPRLGFPHLENKDDLDSYFIG